MEIAFVELLHSFERIESAQKEEYGALRSKSQPLGLLSQEDKDTFIPPLEESTVIVYIHFPGVVGIGATVANGYN